jgi:hypothetical protein
MNNTTAESQELSQEQRAIERLRASRQKLEADLQTHGKEAAIRFVLHDPCADAGCQRRLERAEKGEAPIQDFFDLAKIISGAEGTERDWHADFKAKHGSDIDEPEWITGFIEGALNQFDALEKKL